MAYYSKDGDHIIIQRHFIIMFFKFLKTFIFIFFSFIIYILSIKYSSYIEIHEGLNFVVFTLIFFMINYGFLKFISYIIIYSNNLIILFENQFIIIKCSLIMKDDIEYIDIHKVIKYDSFTRGFWPNVLGYGTFVLEQQNQEFRHFDYISNPHKLLKIFEEQKENNKPENYINE